jgi:hypothetical protein
MLAVVEDGARVDPDGLVNRGGDVARAVPRGRAMRGVLVGGADDLSPLDSAPREEDRAGRIEPAAPQ